MSKAGDVFENPVTGERAIVRIGTEQTGYEVLRGSLTTWSSLPGRRQGCSERCLR